MKVVVIGGGVTGFSTAYHLALLGAKDVTLLEQDDVGAGSSSRAAGITTGLLWTETGIRVRRLALRRLRELSRELPGYCFHNERGCLNLIADDAWPAREKFLPLYDALHAPYQLLDSAEIRRRWPEVRAPKHCTGLHDPLGGYSEPDEYLPALARAARARGVRVVTGTQARSIAVSGSRVKGVITVTGTVEADVVIAATYAWMLPLLASIGISIPLKTFVHQRYLSQPLDAPMAIPPINADPYGGYVRPAAGNRLLLGVETPHREDHRVAKLDFRMTSLTAPPGTVQSAATKFKELIPAIASLRWESERVGLLSFSLDGEPVVGPVSGMSGLFLANCFHSGGFSYSPAIGLLLAEWVTEGEPSIDLTAFSPDRFDRSEVEQFLAVPATQQSIFRRRH
jgi:sarcosine oxidase, subunit beta